MIYNLENLLEHYHIKQVAKHSYTIYIPIEELDLFEYYEAPDMLWIFIEELGIVHITILDTRRE